MQTKRSAQRSSGIRHVGGLEEISFGEPLSGTPRAPAAPPSTHPVSPARRGAGGGAAVAVRASQRRWAVRVRLTAEQRAARRTRTTRKTPAAKPTPAHGSESAPGRQLRGMFRQ
ncbi:hypothetical protein R5R35_011769 [Gryllus longicercus]|uniref:Uncharacterized protein n=1 Tax=Gryllus longicercus TaxID=2509291 RepID=A0AAN9ZBH5_9ORTH